MYKPEKASIRGHVHRMAGTSIPNKVLKAKFEGERSVGKYIKGWENVVQQNAARFLLCRNWKLAGNERIFGGRR
jgi:hypothetical protein